jgi:hypothetical protein
MATSTLREQKVVKGERYGPIMAFPGTKGLPFGFCLAAPDGPHDCIRLFVHCYQ